MKELDEKEFGNMFFRDIIPIAKTYEKERKKLFLIANIDNLLPAIAFFSPFLGGGILVIFLIFCMIFQIEYDEKYNPFLACCIFGGWGLCLIFWGIYGLFSKFFSRNRDNIKTLKNKIKQSVVINIFKLIDIEHLDDYEKNTYSRILSQLGIQDAKADDVLKSEYKNIPFTMVDFCSGYKNNYKNLKLINGLLFAIKSNKTFSGDTIISRYDTSYSAFPSCKKTFLEDVEFNNHFYVYSNEEIDTRYMLTPTFMERLKQLKKTKNIELEIYFTRKTYMDSNIFFVIYTNKDFFDVDINKSLLDKGNYYGIYKEIKEILEIVDALKLDQNIGL